MKQFKKDNTETASLLPAGYVGQVGNWVDNIITTTTRNLYMTILILVTASLLPVGGAPQVRFYQSPTIEDIYCHHYYTLHTRKSISTQIQKSCKYNILQYKNNTEHMWISPIKHKCELIYCTIWQLDNSYSATNFKR